MSFFSFDRNSGAGNVWNYSDPQKDGFSLVLQGVVVELSDPLKTKFKSQEVDRWQDGNPMRNICLTILTQGGEEKNWIFGPGSSKNPSRALEACRAALVQAGVQGQGLEDMGGMSITVQTAQPPEGFSYGQGSPRPWQVRIDNPQKSDAYRGVRHVVDPVTEGGQQPQPQQQTQPQPQPQAQPQQAQPQGTNPVANAVMQAAQAAGQTLVMADGTQMGQPQSAQAAQDMQAQYYTEDVPF